jgi:hypothetical protein
MSTELVQGSGTVTLRGRSNLDADSIRLVEALEECFAVSAVHWNYEVHCNGQAELSLSVHGFPQEIIDQLKKFLKSIA